MPATQRRHNGQKDHGVDEPDAKCCCCEMEFHNPCDGCCDACGRQIAECCAPVTKCCKSTCGGFALIWFTFAWVVQYLDTLAFFGLSCYICYYAFTCTGTTFDCPNKKCADGTSKEPLEGAWTPSTIGQFCCIVAVVLLIFSETYILGIVGGYFDQPFDRSTKNTKKAEQTLWMVCKHFLKFFFLLAMVAVGFQLNPSSVDGDFGDPQDMCYNGQVGNFLWGSVDVETMDQIGPFAFMALAGMLFICMGCMCCASSHSFGCVECHCFSPECYEVLNWGAITIILVGAALGITFMVSAIFMTFFSIGNAVLALMCVSEVMYGLQWMCAFAAPKGSRARKEYERSIANQKTGAGNGAEKIPMVDKQIRPSVRPSVRPSGPASGSLRQRAPTRDMGYTQRGGQRQANYDSRRGEYERTAVDENAGFEVDQYIDEAGANYGSNGDVETGDGDGNCDEDNGGGFGINIDADTVNAIGNQVNRGIQQWNKSQRYNDEDENQDGQEENPDANLEQDPEQDPEACGEDAGGDNGGDEDTGLAFGE